MPVEVSCETGIEVSSSRPSTEHIASNGIGNSGERIEALRQPKIASSADPQTRCWQLPTPQRVCNFASVKYIWIDLCSRDKAL
jgi:hypothetical protein